METTPPFTGLGYTCRVEHPGLIILAAIGEAPQRAATLALAVAVEAWMDQPVKEGPVASSVPGWTNRNIWHVERSGAVGVCDGKEEVLVYCDPAMTDRLRGAMARAGLGRAATEAYKAALAEVVK